MPMIFLKFQFQISKQDILIYVITYMYTAFVAVYNIQLHSSMQMSESF